MDQAGAGVWWAKEKRATTWESENGGLSQNRDLNISAVKLGFKHQDKVSFFFFLIAAQVEVDSTNGASNKRMWILKQRSMEIGATNQGKVLLKRHGENELLGNKNVL